MPTNQSNGASEVSEKRSKVINVASEGDNLPVNGKVPAKVPPAASNGSVPDQKLNGKDEKAVQTTLNNVPAVNASKTPVPDKLKKSSDEGQKKVTTASRPTPVPPSGKIDFPWEKIGFLIDPASPPPIEVLKELSSEGSNRYLHKYVSNKYFGDLYWNCSLAVGTLFFAWAVGYLGGGVVSLGLVLLFSGTVYRSELRRFNINLRDDMKRVSASESLDKRSESMEWLNSFLAKFWVIYMPALSELVITQANAILKDVEPPTPIKKLSLDEFTLGTKAPKVESVRSFTKLGQNVYRMDWDFGFTPNDTDGMTKEQLRKKVDPKVALGISVGKGVVSASLPILVEDMSFKGKMRITFQLAESFPFIEIVSVMFLEPPEIDYGLKPVGGNTFGIDIMALVPGLSSFVNGIIHATLKPMLYAPNHFDVNVRDIVEGSVASAVGCVGVRIRAAEYLKKVDINPYIEYGLQGGKQYRTDIKAATNVPVFNELQYVLVDSMTKKMQFVLWEVNNHGETERLGEAIYELDVLLQDPEQQAVELNIEKRGRTVGKIVCDLQWFPVTPKQTKSDAGILVLTVESAKELSTKQSLLGKLSSYAEVKIESPEDSEPLVSRLVKSSNAPDYQLHFERLIRSKSTSPVDVTIKDTSSYRTTTVASYHADSVAELIELGAEKGKWVHFTKGEGSIRFRVQWKPLSAVGMAADASFVPPIGAYRVFVARCAQLPNLETIGKIDPYVVLASGGRQQGRTRVAEKTVEPKYNEVFYVPVLRRGQRLSLRVMDVEKSGRDREVGSLNVDVARLFSKEYDPQKEGQKALTQGQLTRNGSRAGYVFYKVVYLPLLPVFSQKELKEKQQKEATGEQELADLEEQAKMMKDYKNHPNDYEWIDVKKEVTGKESKDTGKVQLSLNELLTHNSGVLGITVVRASLSAKRAFLQCLIDERAYPEFVSPASRDGKLSSCAGSAFIRDLQNSVVTFRATKTADASSRSDIIGQTAQPLKVKQLLSEGFSEPCTVLFAGNRVELSLEYVPCAVDLGPSESMADTGLLHLKFISASGLKAADTSGKSDPFLIVELDGMQVYRTATVKKTLDPVFNEECAVTVPSRTRSELKLRLFDWDRTGDNDPLGNIAVDMTQIPLDKERVVEFRLDTQGKLKVGIQFQPMYIQPSVVAAGGSTLADGALNIVGGAAGGALNVAQGVAGGALGAVGDVAGGAGKLVGGIAGGIAGGTTGAATGIFKGLRGKNGNNSALKNSHADLSTDSHRNSRSDLRGDSHRNSRNDLRGDLQSTPVKQRQLNDGSAAGTPNGAGAVPPSPATIGTVGTVASKARSSIDGNASFISSSLSGDTIPGRVTVIGVKCAKPPGKESLLVRVGLKSPNKTRDIFKTHAVKYNASAGGLTYNESVPFKAPPSAEMVFSLREHHRLGRSQEVASCEVPLSDIVGKRDEITVPLTLDGNQAQIRVSFNYGN
ncbi:DEKNAAC100563 [Brettanomyces naardenensis]|uniref:DEKNAAC100564 n=1 Tax=Brettanomyces naardenensis TaxID=13370 RepID=A0A448YED5_BRENA|nr:DEKNAAC100563 [Brettanomyces naardenensis]